MIVQNENAKKLDEARRKYRRAYDRGYALSAQGRDIEAQRILDQANDDWAEAQRRYPLTRLGGKPV